MSARLRGLYAITPDDPDGARLLADVEAVLRGGCRFVQYRDKTSLPGERVARAHALRRLTQAFGARLLINDDMALAFLVHADGVHLGRDDGNLQAARAILGPDKLLGASCYADFAAAAHLSCADYLGDAPWEEDEAAKHWYQRVKSRPAFRPLLADRARGMAPSDVYALLDF